MLLWKFLWRKIFWGIIDQLKFISWKFVFFLPKVFSYKIFADWFYKRIKHDVRATFASLKQKHNFWETFFVIGQLPQQSVFLQSGVACVLLSFKGGWGTCGKIAFTNAQCLITFNNVVKKRLQRMSFLVNIAKILRIPILNNICQRQLMMSI